MGQLRAQCGEGRSRKHEQGTLALRILGHHCQGQSLHLWPECWAQHLTLRCVSIWHWGVLGFPNPGPSLKCKWPNTSWSYQQREPTFHKWNEQASLLSSREGHWAWPFLRLGLQRRGPQVIDGHQALPQDNAPTHLRQTHPRKRSGVSSLGCSFRESGHGWPMAWPSWLLPDLTLPYLPTCQPAKWLTSFYTGEKRCYRVKGLQGPA